MPIQTNLFYEDLAPGQTASFGKTITDADIVLFAAVSGDTNPVHVSDIAAAASPFGHRIAHGLLSAGLISAVLGTRLPGPGTIYMSQTLHFLAPVPIGATVTATVEVIELLEHHHVRLRTTCETGGELVIEGEALVKVPSRAP